MISDITNNEERNYVAVIPVLLLHITHTRNTILHLKNTYHHSYFSKISAT